MVTLVATIWLASWSQNKRFDDLRSDMNIRFEDNGKRFEELRLDMNRRSEELRSDMNRRFDETAARLERIESKLDSYDVRVVRLEERTSPIR